MSDEHGDGFQNLFGTARPHADCPDCPAKDAEIERLRARLQTAHRLLPVVPDLAVARALAHLEAAAGVVWPLRYTMTKTPDEYAKTFGAGHVSLVCLKDRHVFCVDIERISEQDRVFIERVAALANAVAAQAGEGK